MIHEIVLLGIGLIAGMVGWWVTTFWMQPILRFLDIRSKVLENFIYYKQVVNSDGLNDEMKSLHRERTLANRKSSADLAAVLLQLPKWYLKYLNKRGIEPQEAASHLIGYSNTDDYEDSHKIESYIRRKLGLPKEE